MNEETIKNEMVVVQGKVFDVIGVNDLVIAELNKQYLPMKIDGADDKKGYEAVHEGLMKYVKARTMVEKHGKATREKAIKFQKDVIAEEKRVIGLLAPGEEHLRAERKTIDDIEARIKAEAEAEEAACIQVRVDRIFAFGASFNGQNYIAYGLQIPAALVKVCTEEQFESFIAQVQGKKDEADAMHKAELERQAAEVLRLQKIAKEQEAERQRLEERGRVQAEEAIRIKAEQAAAENARLAAIAEEERKARIKERLETEEREKKESAIRAEAERVRKEREEWEAIKAQEARDIAAAKQKVIDEARHAAEIEKAKKEAAERAKVEAEAKVKREAEEKAEKERLVKLAAEKRAARAPDKAKLIAFADSLETLPNPELKTNEGKDILIEANRGLDIIIKAMRDKVGAL